MNDPFRVGLLASLPLEMNDMCIVTHNYVYDQFCNMCYKNPVGRKNCRVFFPEYLKQKVEFASDKSF